ncbi:uncharacterized protein At2g29880-like isoform X2 [Tripterygium wilfordii]|nr:uncharacterized protein At2g29880-like isoform X2 [Tripterygium wilfordii]
MARMMRKNNLVVALSLWNQILSSIDLIFYLFCIATSLHIRRPRDRSYVLDFAFQREHLKNLVYESDNTCIAQLRMNRETFGNLCSMLENLGGLKPTKNMLVDEQVAIFLHILSQHVKNRVIQFRFKRSSETISRYFKRVLDAVICLHGELLKKPVPVLPNSTDSKWKWFQNCLGALDETYIKVRVPVEDKARYRNRKGEIATNVLGVCGPDMNFIYVLPGWEGSAADGRVLRDAVSRPNGLKVPHAMSKKAKVQHMWTEDEDTILVNALLDIYNVGTYNADNGFKTGYLGALEKAIKDKIPETDIKAKPHIESRLKTLKKDFSIVYDMVYGPNTSGFGWDPINRCIVAEAPVWEEYIKGHKRAANFRNKEIPHFEALCTIYGKDRANGRNAQDPSDVVEDIRAEEALHYDDDTGYVPDVSWFNEMQGMDVSMSAARAGASHSPGGMSATQGDTNAFPSDFGMQSDGNSTRNKKRKPNNNTNVIDAIREVADALGKQIVKATHELSEAIGTEKRSEDRRDKFFDELRTLEGLSSHERFTAGIKMGGDKTLVSMFFSLPIEERGAFVKSCIEML